MESSLNTTKEDVNTQPNHMEFLLKLEKAIFGLTKDNINETVEEIMQLFDPNLSNSFNIVICNLFYFASLAQNDGNDFHINFLKLLQEKEEKFIESDLKLIEIFFNYIVQINSQETYHFFVLMMENKLLNDESRYLNSCSDSKSSFETFFDIIKDDRNFSKKLILEGVNPNELSKIIRNDEIENLQEISSQDKFNFNQNIKPSPNERHSLINQENVTLIDFAAYFSAIKCFKYLLLNNASVKNTGKYAIAGGNIEIIHLCEQNNSTFENPYEIAIKYHRNDVFKYFYENKNNDNNININKLGCACINNGNFKILSYLLDEGMEVNSEMISESAKMGNLNLVKYFLQNNKISNDLLFYAIESLNPDLVKYILSYKEVDINAIDFYLFDLVFILII